MPLPAFTSSRGESGASLLQSHFLSAGAALRVQMRVLLNASALSGVIVFTVANIMGMNLGTAPDRLTGAASFNDSPLIGQPLFITVS